MKTDIEIARETKLNKIEDVAEKLGVPRDEVQNYGRYIAKVPIHLIDKKEMEKHNLILVSAITPNKAGVGKTTVSIGLSLGLNKIGKKAVVALREPSLGPCFGMKGGAAGGGYSQVLPMENINLHFTGDFHAVTSAHNMITALLDNYIYQNRNSCEGLKEVKWKRVLDVNDRSLRNIVSGLGGSANGIPTETGFDITAASEIMAILCLATDIDDLKRRVGNILLGYTYDGKPFTVNDMGIAGAITVLLKDALLPNLVQTTENTPAFIHGGPFANIAHGCNSVTATRMALKLGDYAITEAGFGADLGAEKFLDIKCRLAGLSPDAVVVVATVRALKMNGGVAKADLAAENVEALRKGWLAAITSLADPEALSAIRLTLTVAAIAVPLNAVFGIAAAWFITKFDFYGKAFLITLIDLPFSVSPVVAGLCIVLTFGANTWLGGMLVHAGYPIVFALPGIILASMFVTFPFVARELIPVMIEQGRAEEEAALTLGASGWRTFWTVTLPNIRWALLYGVVLTNARAIGEFGAVSVVSGSIRGETLSLPLQIELLEQDYNTVGSFTAAALLTLMAILTLFLKSVVQWRLENQEKRQHQEGNHEH